MAQRRAMISGYGLLTAHGNRDETWSGLMRGRAPVSRAFPHADVSFPFGRSFRVEGFDPSQFIPNRSDRRCMGIAMQYATVCAGMALEHAGLLERPDVLQRAALTVAARFGERDEDLDFEIANEIAKPPTRCGDYRESILALMSRNLRPGLFLAQLPNLYAGNIALFFQILGRSLTFVGEHAAGARALFEAVELVQEGAVDVAVTGAAFNAEDYQTRFALAGTGMLSRDEGSDDLTPPKPWCERADGTVLGSGAAFLVVEEAEHARARGALAHAEVAHVGYHSGPRTLRGAADRLSDQYRSWLCAGGEAATVVIGNGAGIPALDREELAFLRQAARGVERDLLLTASTPWLGDLVHASMPARVALAAAALSRNEVFAPPSLPEALDLPEGIRFPSSGGHADLPCVAALSIGYEEGESLAILRRANGQARG